MRFFYQSPLPHQRPSNTSGSTSASRHRVQSSPLVYQGQSIRNGGAASYSSAVWYPPPQSYRQPPPPLPPPPYATSYPQESHPYYHQTSHYQANRAPVDWTNEPARYGTATAAYPPPHHYHGYHPSQSREHDKPSVPYSQGGSDDMTRKGSHSKRTSPTHSSPPLYTPPRAIATAVAVTTSSKPAIKSGHAADDPRTARKHAAKEGPVAMDVAECEEAPTNSSTGKAGTTTTAATTITIPSPPPPTRVIYVPTNDDDSYPHMALGRGGPRQGKTSSQRFGTMSADRASTQQHHGVREHDGHLLTASSSWDDHYHSRPIAHSTVPPLTSASATASFSYAASSILPAVPAPASTISSPLVYDIRDCDVLCGRGAPSLYHAGNQYFKRLVDSLQSQYIAARRMDKPDIATHIVHVIRSRGGRFLKRTKLQGMGPSGHFGWQDIGEQRAYEKACQALREGAPDVRRKLAAQEIAAAALCSIGASAISATAANTSRSRSRSDSDDYSDDRVTGSSAMQHSSLSHKRKGGVEHFEDTSVPAPKHQKRSEQSTVHSRMSDMADSNNEDANRRSHAHVQLLSTDAEDRNDVAATPRDYNDVSDHTAATPTMTNQQREGVVTVVSSDRE